MVYADTNDEKVYRALSRRMRDRYDLFGSLPDTIEDKWIDDIENLQEYFSQFTQKKQRANAFDLRYGVVGGLVGDALRPGPAVPPCYPRPGRSLHGRGGEAGLQFGLGRLDGLTQPGSGDIGDEADQVFEGPSLVG